MPKKPLDRRHFIKSGTALIALPFLEAMLPPLKTWAQENDFKRLFTVRLDNGFYQSEGTGGDAYLGGTSGAKREQAMRDTVALKMPESVLSQLGSFRNKARIYRYLFDDCEGRENGHLDVEFFLRVHMPRGEDRNRFLKEIFPANSFDQLAADVLSVPGQIRSIAYSTNGTPNFSVRNRNLQSGYNTPQALFDALFSISGGNQTNNNNNNNNNTNNEPDPKIVQRRKILDLALEDINRLRGKLSAQDKLILDGHLEDIRSAQVALDRQISQQNPEENQAAPAVCEFPNKNSLPSDPSTYRTTYTQHMAELDAVYQLAQIAFKCDTTRVFSLVINNGQVTPNDFDSRVAEGLIYHDYVAHWKKNYNGDYPLTKEAHGEILRNIQGNYLKQFAGLLGEMESTIDGNGQSAFANSLFYFGTCMGVSQGHNRYNVPQILAGEGGGAFVADGAHREMPHSLVGTNLQMTSLTDFQYTILRKLGSMVTEHGKKRGTMLNI